MWKDPHTFNFMVGLKSPKKKKLQTMPFFISPWFIMNFCSHLQVTNLRLGIKHGPQFPIKLIRSLNLFQSTSYENWVWNKSKMTTHHILLIINPDISLSIIYSSLSALIDSSHSNAQRDLLALGLSPLFKKMKRDRDGLLLLYSDYPCGPKELYS